MENVMDKGTLHDECMRAIETCPQVDDYLLDDACPTTLYKTYKFWVDPDKRQAHLLWGMGYINAASEEVQDFFKGAEQVIDEALKGHFS